ncbi:MAG: hypothetical protein G4V63_00985, partial [Candidatus Afipia apatlaquensis]|nr:hypothetical protein [Candidatus Afipia apatlaquensis]
EMIVLIHHPLNWIKDKDDVATYLRSRARVVISGHEHDPKVHVEQVEANCDLMMLASGATVPFKSDDIYTFTYNVLEFDWDSNADALVVTIHPRAWNPVRTSFEADHKRLGGKDPKFVLSAPGFRSGTKSAANVESQEAFCEPSEIEPVVEVVAAIDGEGEPAVPPEIEGYRLVLLRFFRDLTEGERLRLLVELGAVPSGSDERMTQAAQRHLLDWLVREGKIGDVERLISDFINKREAKGDA